MAGDDTGARLRYVADRFAGAWQAAGWWISQPDGDRLVTRWVRWRDGGPPALADGGAHPVAGAPVDERVVPVAARDGLLEAMDGGSCVARPGDASGLGEWLPGAGLAAVVVAGGYDQDARQWMVAVLLREGGADAAVARLALTSVVQAALFLPPPRRRP